MSRRFRQLIFICIGLLFINFLSGSFYFRWDLTHDKRYSLSKESRDLVKKVNKNLIIKVYLEGDFPAEFKRLQIETKQFLEELEAENNEIVFQFINPEGLEESLIKKGARPSQLTIEEGGKLSSLIIFPWAEVSYGKRTKLVSLLPKGIMQSQEQQMQVAIENLEFSFANAINLLLTNQRKKIAVISGNGQLEDIQLYSLLSNVTEKYSLGKITLDSVATSPQKTLNDLNNFDLAIIAKPTQNFTEAEKYTLDQFIMKGGRTLWMIDNVKSDTDSLYNDGKMLAYPRNLNLTDLLFSYGVRVNTTLVKDLYASKIPLATGSIGNQPQFQNLDWFYHPLVDGNPYHPITKNISAIRLRFANPIDTLDNHIKKTPLLVSSLLTKIIGTPNIIELSSVSEEPTEKDYSAGYHLFGVLLEGSFRSNYKGRVKPFPLADKKDSSADNKMIVISDGDIGRNQILKGKPFDLSRDKWTNERFGNKDFLINAIDYLLDDSGLIALRNKTLQINLLDKQRAFNERTYWQFVNVMAPLLILLLFGISFTYLKRRKYTK